MPVIDTVRPDRLALSPDDCAPEWRWGRRGVRFAYLGVEGGGVPKDYSPFNHEIAVDGTTTWVHDRFTGRTIQTSGTGGLRIVPNAGSNMPGMTLVFFGTLVDAGDQYYADGRSNGGTYLLLGFSNLSGVDWGGQTLATDIQPFADTAYVTIVRNDGANSTAFVSGLKETTVAQTSGNRRTLGTNYRIGNRFTDSSPWDGGLHGFWAYDHALTDNECYELSRDPWGPWRRDADVVGIAAAAPVGGRIMSSMVAHGGLVGAGGIAGATGGLAG